MSGNYKDRIIKERKSLEVKINKLQNALGKINFALIDEGLLKLQLDAMETYRDILTERLAR